MQRGFAITINLPPDYSDFDAASDIFDDLEAAGHEVISVNPIGGKETDTISVKPQPTQSDSLSELDLLGGF